MKFNHLFNAKQMYRIEFVYSNGKDKTSKCQHWNDYGIGINDMHYDRRDSNSKRAMAHHSECNKGYWTITKNDDRKTYSIDFISSSHGGDKQFSKYGLGMMDDDNFSSMEKRSEHSQFVMAHADESKKGKWLILPAETLGINKDNFGAADRHFDIVFVSCNDGSNSQFAGYRLALGERQQDTRDSVSQFVMAINHELHSNGKWRITRKMDDASNWMENEGISSGVSREKKKQISLFLQDDAGVAHPEDFLELQQEDPECFENFVTLLPSLKRKRFHTALDEFSNEVLTAESHGEEGGWCNVLDDSDEERTVDSQEMTNIQTAYARMTCCEDEDNNIDHQAKKKPKFGGSKFKSSL